AGVVDFLRSVISQMQKTKRTTHKQLSRIGTRLTHKRIYSIFLFVFLVVLLFNLPIFLTPWEGHQIQSFYQVMDNPLYQAMQWANKNTPPGSVFASDAEYGWWF